MDNSILNSAILITGYILFLLMMTFLLPVFAIYRYQVTNNKRKGYTFNDFIGYHFLGILVVSIPTVVSMSVFIYSIILMEDLANWFLQLKFKTIYIILLLVIIMLLYVFVKLFHRLFHFIKLKLASIYNEKLEVVKNYYNSIEGKNTEKTVNIMILILTLCVLFILLLSLLKTFILIIS